MSRDADAIVIGGGIVGAACACELARAGLQVLVLDDRRAGATAAGMGHLVVMDDNPAELALTRHSLDLWRQWSTELDADCAWHPCGTLWLAANADEMAAAEDKQARLRAHGVACDLVDAATLRTLEPELRDGLHGALRVSGDSAVYAPNAARWLLGRYPRQVRVLNTEALEIDGDRVRVTGGSWLHADAVVLASGIHARQLCPELPLRAKKGQLLITDRYPGRVRHQLVELGYVASAHDSSGASVAFNVQPRPTGQLLIGSSREFDHTSPHVDDAMLARMLDRALGYMPGLASLNAIRCWTGVRAATPDGLPLLGPHPERPGLWLATGHEGLGVTTAPASATLLAAMIAGAPCELDPRAYLPQRFIAHALAA
jgi:glycine/D-amino acid oxidase-like deaminating enzyme